MPDKDKDTVRLEITLLTGLDILQSHVFNLVLTLDLSQDRCQT
jgi:hypothetical protein